MTNISMLTVSQVVSRTGLPRAWVYQLVENRRVEFVKGPGANGKIRISERSIDLLLAESRTPANVAHVDRSADDALPDVANPFL